MTSHNTFDALSVLDLGHDEDHNMDEADPAGQQTPEGAESPSPATPSRARPEDPNIGTRNPQPRGTSVAEGRHINIQTPAIPYRQPKGGVTFERPTTNPTITGAEAPTKEVEKHFILDSMRAFKALEEGFKIKKDVVMAFASKLDEALAEFKGARRAFAMSLRERISVAIGEELGAITSPNPIEARGRRPTGPTPPTSRNNSRSNSKGANRRDEPLSYRAIVDQRPPTEPKTQEGPKKQATKPPAKKAQGRIFLRVGGPIKENHPAMVRSVLNKVTGNMIHDVRRISSGYVVIPNKKEDEEKILQKEEEVKRVIAGAKLEKEKKWYTYIVPAVPDEIRGQEYNETTNKWEEVKRRTIDDETAREAKAMTGQTPHKIAWGKKVFDAGTKTAIVTFEKKVEKTWRLFSTSMQARLAKDKVNVLQCSNCYGYHDTRSCKREHRCPTCGKGHEGELCEHPVQCVNCHGPFEATHEKCPAKPEVRNGEKVYHTRAQLIAIRKAGEAGFRAANAN